MHENLPLLFVINVHTGIRQFIHYEDTLILQRTFPRCTNIDEVQTMELFIEITKEGMLVHIGATGYVKYSLEY